MAGIGDRVRVRLTEARLRRRWLDHLLRTFTHYGAVQGSTQAGAVTFFGFLSVFPLLALAFFVVGQVSRFYDGPSLDVAEAINEVLPGIIGNGEGAVPLSTFETAAGAAGVIGAIGLLYSGLNLLSGMRVALLVVFERPTDQMPSFVAGKVQDLLTLASLGTVLLLSVSVSSVVNLLSGFLLGLVGLDDDLQWALRLLTVVIGVLVSTVMFFALFRLLGQPLAPSSSLWRGAALGAVGFEVLKQLSGVLIGSTQNQPAFAVFGVALVLLVWINYSARVTLLAAAWAHTSEGARLLRQAREAEEQRRIDATVVRLAKRPEPEPAAGAPAVFAGGVLSTLAGVLLLQRRRRFRSRSRS